MTITTTKRIYATEFTANMIAAKLAKHKGEKFSVVKIPSGFQVVGITMLPSAMPPRKPKPVQQGNPLIILGKGLAEVWTFRFNSETDKYLSVLDPAGNVVWFGKGTVLGYEVHETLMEETTVTIKFPVSVAKKRNVAAIAIQQAA